MLSSCSFNVEVFLNKLLIGLLSAFLITLHAEQTLSIIKPDAVAANHIGSIEQKFEKAGLKIVALKMTKLSKQQAEEFYSIHKDKPFYPALVDFMTSGPVVVQVLEGENAVSLNRKVMGATDPKKADSGTIRAEFGKDMSNNAVHGSDSIENAKKEIDFFFKPSEIFPKGS